ncbi:hypothetical protein F0P96_15495 [Hymenobacter busanensis]|uniref:Uncharacterized protein n=1 Tax=Hymenobacter busanensis TaxID=2607656 RepID=A0A7L5A122_9BACT|nr:hypothetical protein [Hymenobacter busanensis]KAA9331635.1 hypothetical protein F0P96_15495 [Hymenobacter busanensis]QHJ08786.1 hypothetical protein GUY19_16430 [Hymenobacter busanensis]
MKNLLIIVALVLAAALSLLLAPPPAGAEDYYGTYVQLSRRTGFVLNYDSFGYIAAAAHPATLLQAGEVRQSRPLFVLLAAAVGYPLAPLFTRLVGEQTVQTYFWNTTPVPIPLAELIGLYPVFVLLNFGVLIASLWLFAWLYPRLTAGQGSAGVMYTLMVFMASGQITKAFFWTAHQQMFCFFTPLFCLALLLWLHKRPITSPPLVTLALVLGLLPLVYGNFVLCLPCLWYAGWQRRTNGPPGRFWLQMLLVSGAFALPTLGWIVLLKSQGVTYYNHEVARYRQLVWVLDLLQQPSADWWPTVAARLRDFGRSLNGIVFFLVAVPGVWLLMRLRRAAEAPALPQPLGFLLLLFGGFLLGLGYYQERLTFTLVPLLLCYAAVLLARWPFRYQWLPVALTALGWHLFNVLSYGPFS